MPVREFTDEDGVQWRAWDVAPTSIMPETRGEDYLGDLYSTGWVVFESPAGGQKRRLTGAPWPLAKATEEELRRMLARAAPVRAGVLGPAARWRDEPSSDEKRR